jgi:hypothetical protein
MIFSSCRIGQTLKDVNSVSKDVNRVASDFRDIRGVVVPVDTFVMVATAGLLTELSSLDSEAKLDSISARINRILTRYLNETFQNLDPGPVGKKAVQGALDPLLAAETEARMKNLISALSAQLSRDIAGIITELSSPENKAKLNSLLTSFFSEANSAEISAFVNRALRDIEFDSLGRRISDELITQNLNPAIDSLVRTAVKGIFDEIRNDENARGLFGDIRHILFLALGLLGVIIGLFFWWNRRKSVQLNRMLVNAIEDLDEKTGKDVKKEVAKKARHEGLLPDLDKMLEKEHLLKRKDAHPGA